MLQRIQSVWLLLAAVFCAITFRFPFYSGDWIKDNFLFVIDLNAKTTIWFTILTVLDAVLAFITIFLFYNRKLQLRLTYLGTFLTAMLLTLYFFGNEKFHWWKYHRLGDLLFCHTRLLHFCGKGNLKGPKAHQKFRQTTIIFQKIFIKPRRFKNLRAFSLPGISFLVL